MEFYNIVWLLPWAYLEERALVWLGLVVCLEEP